MLECLGDFSDEESAVGKVGFALFDKIEKVSMLRVLLSQEIKLTLFAWELEIFHESVDFNDILVLELAKDGPLIGEMLALLGAFRWNCLYHQLDLLLRNQEDLGVAAAAKGTEVLCGELHKNYNRMVG